jgi:8-oxo-dGTP diphosphatase
MYSVIPCVIFLIKNTKGDILVGQRENKKGKIYKGLWDIPGGRIEKAESIENAIKRELKEETNLDIINYTLIDVYHHTGENIEGKPGIILLYELCVNGNVSANDDILNLQWLNIKEIKLKRLTPWSKYFVNNI